ncbi:MAG: hypothetical protein WCS97_02060 [Candidatus Paceibacterota bacterium]|jgi:hypothetical protein
MRDFQGSVDESAIVLEGVFPESDLIVSSPLEFSSPRSGVYVEGSLEHVEIIFKQLFGLLNVYIDEKLFGRWIGVTPPAEDSARTILHYEAVADFEKVRLLNFVFREQLAKICNMHLSTIAVLFIKFEGKELDRRWVALPEGFVNGSIRLPKLKTKKPETSSCPAGESLQ